MNRPTPTADLQDQSPLKVKPRPVPEQFRPSKAIGPSCYRCKNDPCTCNGVSLYHGDCINLMNAMPADSVDLVFSSPPYCDARTYGIDAQRDCVEWVNWMLDVTEAAARVCKGPVIWVAAGVTRKRCYWPAVEGLMWEWYRRAGTHELYRPCVFHRAGIPGSGGKDWFRADWEYIACFKRPGDLPWADNTACGHPPKWAPGGEMSHRLNDGQRVNQWGGSYPPDSESNARNREGKSTKKFRPSHRQHTKRRADGEMEVQGHAPPVLANPGNVFAVPVGGGVMGDAICHENEAPFPEKLAEIFVRSCCPPAGLCLDPFAGSGTTGKVARQFGRRCILIDIRESQIELCVQRLRQELLWKDAPPPDAAGEEPADGCD